MSDNEKLYNTAEAAKLLCFMAATMAVWRSLAKGPTYVKIGRSIRYRRADLLAWSNADEVQRTSIEKTARCHKDKRQKTKRSRGRAAGLLRERRLASEPYCRDCRSRGFATLADQIDHIVPLSLGGSDEEQNVRSLCTTCHAKRTREQFALRKIEVGPVNSNLAS